jgi:acyl-CoA synthetase (AMP-forming)/AMP-acid ligase II
MIRTDLIAPIGELIGRQASTRPEAMAFVDKSRAVTYGDLAARTARIAAYLETNGVQPGQSVALFLPHGVAWVEACFAILRADAVVVPISIDSTDSEIAYRLADAGCSAVFANADQAARLAALDGSLTMVLVGSGGAGDLETIATAPLPKPPRDPGDIEQARFIVYTSGTTGQAKGVRLSLRGMLWVTAACWAPIAGLNQDDFILNPLPLYHSYALNLAVLSVLATGAKAYILERFSTSEILRLLDTERFTVLPGVPTMFRFLLDSAKARGKTGLSSVRVCLSAGAVMAGTLNQDFESWFGIKLLDGYGITETSTMVTLNWPTGTRIMGSCGLPVPGLAVRLVDAQDRDVAIDDEGELIVRGPNVMLGYHRKPAETQAALRDGWYRSGDLARYDTNGYITITGRLKEVIIRGGQNISPVEVEDVVARHPAVADCAVVGLPHALLGEVPVAFVVARAGQAPDPAILLEHCRTLLSAYKVPQSFHIVAEIPRTGSGKAMRFKLKQLFPPD